MLFYVCEKNKFIFSCLYPKDIYTLWYQLLTIFLSGINIIYSNYINNYLINN